MALLDFATAFGFLRIGENEARPWRHALEHQVLARHYLHPHLPTLGDGAILGRNLWDAFEEWWIDQPSGRLSAGPGIRISRGEAADFSRDLEAQVKVAF